MAVEPIVCLMGPTGAGKTALACRLVATGRFQIVSVDSGMIYRGLDIGTAKPDPVTRARAPHALIDICDITERYSAARFVDDAKRVVAAIHAQRRVPLLVGGTGLYFRALLGGLATLPDADPALRRRLAAERARLGTAALHARLAAVDPVAAARIHPNDPQRIERALEVWELTGQPISTLQARPPVAALSGRIVQLALAPAARDALHDRIARRARQMLMRGWINETRAARAAQAGTAALPGLKIVGYREISAYLDGQMEYRDLGPQIVRATRRLAKRQLTWLRGTPDLEWFDSENKCLYNKVSKLLKAAAILD